MDDLDRKIIELANQGLRGVDVAERLGVSKTLACGRMSRLVMSGHLERAITRKGSAKDANKRTSVLHQRYQIAVGNVGPALMQLDMQQAQWLFEQIPHGMTVAEWLVALAKDAYAEENGDA